MLNFESLPSRGAWIEMSCNRSGETRTRVAPLAGSVDRNRAVCGNQVGAGQVAPLAGSVDRNELGLCTVLVEAGRSPRGERG